MIPTLEITGLDALQARLQQLADDMPNEIGSALRAEAEIEMTEAKRRTPVKTGALRASGMVTGPTVSGGEISVTMSFGGGAVDYAIEVHENLAMFHPRGGQAKFLESVVLESAPYLGQRVAERMSKGLGQSYAPSADEISASEDAVDALGVDEE